MQLVGIQPIIDILALTLQTPFIKNEANGVSLMLIASPETAKTTSIFKYSNLDFVSYYDEITQKKLIDEFIPLVKNNQKRTLLIPDLINCIEKQKSTRNQFLNMIKSGIDDTGIVRISTFHKQLQYMKLKEGIKFNMITAITGDNFHKIIRYMKQTGLLSRFLPFTYKYPLSLVKQIFMMIEGEKSNWEGVTIPKIYKKDKDVSAKPALFKEFEFISTSLGREYGAYGIRSQVSLQRLAKANALLDKRTEVNKDDISKIVKLSDWMNLKFNSI